MSILSLLLFLPLSASDEVWSPQRIPTAGAVPFVFYYQQFLLADPFAIETRRKSPEIEADNRRRHQKSAELYAAMADTATRLAQSNDLPPAAPSNIERERSKHIAGSWNLYQNVPINAADLHQEALYMQFRALYHETALDPAKIAAMYDLINGLEKDLEKDADLMPLFLRLKRAVSIRALALVFNPLFEHLEKPEKPLPEGRELGEKLSVVAEWFVPFLQKYPNENNFHTVGTFLDMIELYRTHDPDSEHVPKVMELFRSAFAYIQTQDVEPLIKEYAEVYEGVLRRWELLGKPMPIWGADLSGKIIDEKAWEGKVVLLDFWATWCGPCVAEFPHLKLLYQKYQEKGFEIVGFSVDSDQEALQAYLSRNPLPWVILSKESTERAGLPPLSRYYGAKALPLVLLRDRSGKAIMLDARGEKLDDMLETLFE